MPQEWRYTYKHILSAKKTFGTKVLMSNKIGKNEGQMRRNIPAASSATKRHREERAVQNSTTYCAPNKSGKRRLQHCVLRRKTAADNVQEVGHRLLAPTPLPALTGSPQRRSSALRVYWSSPPSQSRQFPPHHGSGPLAYFCLFFRTDRRRSRSLFLARS